MSIVQGVHAYIKVLLHGGGYWHSMLTMGWLAPFAELGLQCSKWADTKRTEAVRRAQEVARNASRVSVSSKINSNRSYVAPAQQNGTQYNARDFAGQQRLDQHRAEYLGGVSYHITEKDQIVHAKVEEKFGEQNFRVILLENPVKLDLE